MLAAARRILEVVEASKQQSGAEGHMQEPGSKIPLQEIVKKRTLAVMRVEGS